MEKIEKNQEEIMTQIKLIKKEYQNFEKNKVENDKIKEIIKSFPEINTKLELVKKNKISF